MKLFGNAKFTVAVFLAAALLAFSAMLLYGYHV
jgi:hypothetical protein